MNLEIFENRNNSMKDYLVYLTNLKQVKLEGAVNGDGTMMEYNIVSHILDDLNKMIEKESK